MILEVTLAATALLLFVAFASNIFSWETVESFQLDQPQEAICIEEHGVEVKLDSHNRYHVREIKNARVRVTNKRMLIGEPQLVPPGANQLHAVVHFRKGDKMTRPEEEAYAKSGFGVYMTDAATFTYEPDGQRPAIRMKVQPELGPHQLQSEIVIYTDRVNEYRRIFELKSR